MTQAVCFKCGELKLGSFCRCNICQSVPRTDEELVLSLAMSDHYFDLEVLEQMSDVIKSGQQINLSKDTREEMFELIGEMRSEGILAELERIWAEEGEN